jgi:predicted ester cyclase
MSGEELKNRLLRAREEQSKGNVEALNEVYATDCVYSRPPFPETRGLENLKKLRTGVGGAYSDIRTIYDEIVVEGNTLVMRWTWKVKHTGQSPTIPTPPTGKEVVMVGCTVYHWKDGKIVEELEYADYLGFLQQMGVVAPLKK